MKKGRILGVDKGGCIVYDVSLGGLMSKWGEVIHEIPDGFIDRATSPDDEYYPDGINDNTLVEVVIHNKRSGDRILCRGEAQCFGWAKQPATPCCSGLDAMDVPLTHYRKI